MSTIANLLIRVGVDTKAAEAGLARVGATSGKSGALIRRSFVPAIAVLAGLGLAAKVGFDKMGRVQKLTEQTNAVIKSTGGVAKISSGGVRDLANALADKSGYDDELIHKGANMLLTFKNIRNETGKGNDIFNQSTAAVLDLSIAMGQDTKQSAIMLGKALNDPVQGLSAMRRVGIQFTKAQETQIKTMVESGDVMGAQKVILKELESQFGGSAEAAGKTLGGQLSIAKQRFEGLSMNITRMVLPAVMAFTGALMAVTGFMAEHETATKIVVGVLGALATAFIAANIVIRLHAVYTTLATAASKLAAGAAKTWAATQWLLNAAFLGFPLIAIIALVAAFVAGIIIAYKNSSTFRAIVQAAFNAVKVAVDAVKTAMQAIPGIIRAVKDHPVVQAIVAYYTAQFRLIVGAVKLVISAVEGVVGAVRAAWKSPLVSALRQAFGNAFSAIKSVVNSAADAVSNVIAKVQTAVGWVQSLISKVSSIPKPPGWLSGGLLSRFANGGIVTGPTRALIGEAGPEVVIPLTRPRRAQELLEATGLAGGRGGGGPTVHIDTMVVQDATDIDRVASRLGRQLLMAGA